MQRNDGNDAFAWLIQIAAAAFDDMDSRVQHLLVSDDRKRCSVG
jgi:hypothetical protein